MVDHPQQSKQKKRDRSTLRNIFKLSSSDSSLPIAGSSKAGSRNRLLGKLFNKPESVLPSRSTSPLPSTSSNQNLGTETISVANPKDSTDSTPTGISLHTGSSPQFADHQAPTTSAERPLPVIPLVVQNQDESSVQQHSITSISLVQSHVVASKPVETTQSQAAPPESGSTVMDSLKLTGRFLQTVVTKAAGIVDSNPAKVALSLATAVMEAKGVVDDNRNAVRRRIESTGAQLATLASAMDRWSPKNDAENQQFEKFTKDLGDELKELEKLRDGTILRRILDHEDEQKRIADIFERVNEARVQFELAINMRVFKNVYEMEKGVRKLLLKELAPSKIADHKYYLESKTERQLRRGVCTPGTRVRILDEIVTWAKSTSADCPNLYWLFGPAGAGKSTIAYTIARRFEFAGDATDTIILGGNFFCSRQFEETRLSKYIVRTIVHHLTLKCKAFADKLSDTGDLETVNQNVSAQLEGLLLAPWEASEFDRRPDPSSPPPRYLIVIDALDEIDEKGGSEFLRDLLNLVRMNKNQLKGLKFFITSRQDQDLVHLVESFDQRQLYRLQDVAEEEVQADIVAYLTTRGLHFNNDSEVRQLAAITAGLFIYAVTIVNHLQLQGKSEQKKFLAQLVANSNSSVSQPSSNEEPFKLLDELYTRIVDEAFHGFKPPMQGWMDRLSILHSFLCAAEHTSTSVVADLLFTSEMTDVADTLLSRLHAVLYVEGGKVLWYHKSFVDFVFTKDRSKGYWCDQTGHHRLLTARCFHVMKKELRFNIANITSSFLLDEDNAALPNEIRRIHPVLSYSCRNWDHHLRLVTLMPFDQSDPLLETLSEFLHIRILFWIEVMNLLQARGRCEPMLRAVSEWLTGLQVDLPLAGNLAEAGSFALYFSGSGASASTPHLYISVLATWPRNSDLCRRWKGHFPRIPVFTNALLGGTLLMTVKVNSGVNAVAISRDGNHIVSGSYDGLVRVWDASTGDQLKQLKGHAGWVLSVALSLDFKRIVSGSDDESVRVWDASTGDELKQLNGHTGQVSSVAFSPDGKRIASGSFDQSVRVWDASTGDELKQLNGHTGQVLSVAFSPNGKHVVSGSSDGSARLWDASTGDELKQLKGHIVSVFSVAFSQDGKCIVSGSLDRSVRVWDTSTGYELKQLNGHVNWVTSVACSPDGKHIVSGSYDKTVRVWDASTGDELKQLDGHTSRVSSVTFSADSKQIVSGSSDRSMRVWDVSTGNELKQLDDHTNSILSVAYSRDGAYIVSGSSDTSVRVWDASTGDELKQLNGHTDWVLSVAFSPDGERVASGSYDKSVRVWDPSTGDKLNELNGHTDWVRSIAFSADGKHIVSGSSDKSVRVWHASTGAELKQLNGHTESVLSVALSQNGKHIVSGSLDQSVRVWDALTGDQLKQLDGHTGPVVSVAFSRGDERVVSGSQDKSVRVWNASTGNELKQLNGHTDSVMSVVFSQDDRFIVSGSEDTSVRLWDASTGDELKRLNGHTDRVWSVAFSSDGQYIVSGSFDKTVRVWDALTVAELQESNGPPDMLSSAPYSSDGSDIVSGSFDNSVRVWNASSSEKLKELDDPSESIISASDSRHFISGQRDDSLLAGNLYTSFIRETDPERYDEHTGWLLSPDGQVLLMFVPPEARLPDSSNILTIPRFARSYVDFTHAVFGSQWTECYRP